MNAPREQQRAILELWEVLLRHRWRFVIPVFIVAVMVLSAGFMLPRKYRATAIFERRTDMVLSEMSTRGATRAFSDPHQSLAEEIAGQPAIDELLKSLDAELRDKGYLRTEADRQVLRDDIWRHVLVTWDIATAELARARVEYVGGSAELAEMVVNGLVENYIARTRIAMEKRLTESAGFFEGEAATHRAKIEALENQLLEFEIANGDLLPQTPNNLEDKIATLQDTVQDTVNLRDAAAMRVQTIQQALASTPAEVPTVVRSRNPEIAALEKQLGELTTQLHKYTVEWRMTEAHPDVQQTRRQITDVEARLASADAEVVTERQLASNPKRQELELELTRATGEQRAYSDRVTALKKQISELDAATGQIFEVRSTHRRLQREREESQRQLGFWEDNLRRVQMALTAESGNRGVQLEFLQPASASARPVSPNLGQLLMGAVALSLLAGGVSVFIAHRADDTFTDGDAIERALDLPLFGSVSEIVTAQHRRLRRLRHLVLYPIQGATMAAVLLAIATGLYLDLEDPRRFEELRTGAIASVLDVAGPQAAEAAPMPEHGPYWNAEATSAEQLGAPASDETHVDEAHPAADAAPHTDAHHAEPVQHEPAHADHATTPEPATDHAVTAAPQHDDVHAPAHAEHSDASHGGEH